MQLGPDPMQGPKQKPREIHEAFNFLVFSCFLSYHVLFSVSLQEIHCILLAPTYSTDPRPHTK